MGLIGRTPARAGTPQARFSPAVGHVMLIEGCSVPAHSDYIVPRAFRRDLLYHLAGILLGDV